MLFKPRCTSSTGYPPPFLSPKVHMNSYMANHPPTPNSNPLDVFAIHGFDPMQSPNSNPDQLHVFFSAIHHLNLLTNAMNQPQGVSSILDMWNLSHIISHAKIPNNLTCRYPLLNLFFLPHHPCKTCHPCTINPPHPLKFHLLFHHPCTTFLVPIPLLPCLYPPL